MLGGKVVKPGPALNREIELGPKEVGQAEVPVQDPHAKIKEGHPPSPGHEIVSEENAGALAERRTGRGGDHEGRFEQEFQAAAYGERTMHVGDRIADLKEQWGEADVRDSILKDLVEDAVATHQAQAPGT